MDDFHEIRDAVQPRDALRLASWLGLLDLLGILLAVASDVQEVAREFGLRDEMRERLRRALDRVGCAQVVLKAMREERANDEARGEDDSERPDDGADRDLATLGRVRGAIRGGPRQILSVGMGWHCMSPGRHAVFLLRGKCQKSCVLRPVKKSQLMAVVKRSPNRMAN
jgi:hypothetical protein